MKASVPRDAKTTSADVQAWNARFETVIRDTDQAVHSLLGSRYPILRDWIRAWWPAHLNLVRQRPRYRSEDPSDDYILVAAADWCGTGEYATQYSGSTPYEVALPDKYIKFANRGWPTDPAYNNPPYTVDLYRYVDGQGSWTIIGVLVNEVGPWNEDDNYWDDSAVPRLFKDVGLCNAEAEWAFYYRYNNGKDQFGRRVRNPAAIDLTPQVAADLGLGYLQNDFISVRYIDLP